MCHTFLISPQIFSSNQITNFSKFKKKLWHTFGISSHSSPNIVSHSRPIIAVKINFSQIDWTYSFFRSLEHNYFYQVYLSCFNIKFEHKCATLFYHSPWFLANQIPSFFFFAVFCCGTKWALFAKVTPRTHHVVYGCKIIVVQAIRKSPSNA